MKRLQPAALAAAAAIILGAGSAVLLAQAREWTTSNGDAQRSSWVRSDARLTKDAVQKGEFKFLWKMPLANETRQLHSLTQPILLDRLISHRGFKALAFVGASSERVYAVDTDLARTYWETVINYSSITPPAPSSWACPGGLVAAVTRHTAVSPPAFGRGFGGRGARTGSSVGEAGRGAPSLQERDAQGRGEGQGRGRGAAAPAAGRGRGPAAPPAPGTPAAQAARGRGAAPSGLGGGPTENIFVLGSDGFVRALNAHNGAERYPAVQFIPGNANAAGLIFVDGMLYTSTSGECGAVPNGVYAINLDIEDGKTIMWHTGGPSVAGAAGPTFGTDGTIFVAVSEGPASTQGGTSAPAATNYSSSVVALDPKTLKVKDWFTAPGADFNASPVVFRDKEKDIVLATANDGRLYLLDGSSLGGPDHKTPLHVTAKYTAPGLTVSPATWEDGTTRWILVPAAGPPQAGTTFAANGPRPNGAVLAFKLTEEAGKLSLAPAWSSRDMTSPLTPLIFNGVVFAASSGEYKTADPKVGATQRARRSIPAVLYALDPATGKELWSSGKTITSFARAGLSGSAGQVYVVTFDNTLYGFGIPMEH